MSSNAETALPKLPMPVERAVKAFVQAADETLGDDLDSVVMYGSAAEGRLRASSDVNLILVLTTFRVEALDGLREALRTAKATCNLSTMFVVRYEIPQMAVAFAGKFSDILHRHVVLYGDDPFRDLEIPREALIAHLRQTLLNLVLRTRDGYLTRSLREEQLSPLLADLAGPLRSAAAVLLRLEGEPVESPKEALIFVAGREGGDTWLAALERMSYVRDGEVIPPGTASQTVLGLLALAERLLLLADQLA